jgi:hypothetical protein
VLSEHNVLLNVHAQENMYNQSELCHSEMEYICTYTSTYNHTYIETYVHTYICTYIYMFIHTYLCTCIHACIAWIHNCLTKTVGFGTSHIYSNIQYFYSVKYYKHFIKQ